MFRPVSYVTMRGMLQRHVDDMPWEAEPSCLKRYWYINVYEVRPEGERPETYLVLAPGADRGLTFATREAAEACALMLHYNSGDRP